MCRLVSFVVSFILGMLLFACDRQETASSTTGSVESPTVKALSPSSHLKAPNNLPESAFEVVDWTDLMPEEDLEALRNPPDYLSEIEDGSEADQLTSQFKNSGTVAEDRYQQALVSKEIRPEFNGRHIRIPGYIVPLEFDDFQTITTFFLVPFFGACIHLPPPPPNQIIYAEFEPGIRLDALYDPFWINGTLYTTLMENDMATAAYSMAVSGIELYEE